MIILDTDHVSFLQWDGEPAERLRQRLQNAGDDWIGVTAITLEEQSRGVISKLGQCKKISDQPKYYARLSSVFRFFGRWKFAEFDDESAELFVELRKTCSSVGKSDLKIASVAIVNDALLLTANARDFDKVPGLRHENWLN